MSASAVESSGGDILDAGTATDEEVRAALGVGDAGGDEDPTGEPEEEVGQGVTLDSLAAIVEAQRIQIATLKREKAAERVAAGKAKVGTATDDPNAAVTAAVEQAKADARLEYGIKLAGSEVKAALASMMTDAQITAFVDDLNLAKYVNDDGDPDADAIAALKARQSALLGRRPAAKVGHGKQGEAGGKKSNADLFAEALQGAFTQ